MMGEVWRQVPRLPQVLASSEGRIETEAKSALERHITEQLGDDQYRALAVKAAGLLEAWANIDGPEEVWATGVGVWLAEARSLIPELKK